jgi:hypothetical protein
MTGEFEIKGITHSQTTISRGNAEIYATTLVDAKLEQEALFTFMESKTIKETLWRDHHRKIIMYL